MPNAETPKSYKSPQKIGVFLWEESQPMESQTSSDQASAETIPEPSACFGEAYGTGDEPSVGTGGGGRSFEGAGASVSSRNRDTQDQGDGRAAVLPGGWLCGDALPSCV